MTDFIPFFIINRVFSLKLAFVEFDIPRKSIVKKFILRYYCYLEFFNNSLINHNVINIIKRTIPDSLTPSHGIRHPILFWEPILIFGII